MCAPNTIDLTAPDVTAGSDDGLNFTYWIDANATDAIVNPNAVATGGTYYIKATSASGCSIIKPVLVTVNTGSAPIVIVTDPAQSANRHSGSHESGHLTQIVTMD